MRPSTTPRHETNARGSAHVRRDNPSRTARPGTTQRHEHPTMPDKKTRDAPTRRSKRDGGTRSPGTSENDEQKKITSCAVFPSSHENETKADERSTARRTIAASDEEREHRWIRRHTEDDENETATAARDDERTEDKDKHPGAYPLTRPADDGTRARRHTET